MAKIPFDIKYRPQIESGEYKVILDCGVEAEILAWDKPGEYPIVCMAKKEGAIPFRVNSNGIAYHYSEGSNYSDLFIVMPGLELTEFEKRIEEICNLYEPGKRDSKDQIRYYADELLELARKELIEEQYTSDPRKTDLYKLGKAEALKDLPRWKKIKEVTTKRTEDGDCVTTEALLVKGWRNSDDYIIIEPNCMINQEMLCIPVRLLYKLPKEN